MELTFSRKLFYNCQIMSGVAASRLEVTSEQERLSLPMADMLARQAPRADSEYSGRAYVLGEGLWASVAKPYSNGTVPITLYDEAQHGDANWTPGYVNGPNFRVKRAWWEDEDGILVPTGILEPLVDAMEATKPRLGPKRASEKLEIEREALATPASEGVDTDRIRQLRNDLFWAACQGVDLV
jgi:hypothetical protein